MSEAPFSRNHFSPLPFFLAECPVGELVDLDGETVGVIQNESGRIGDHALVFRDFL